MGDTVGEIENGLAVAEEILPTLFGALGLFFPQIAAFSKFLPLLPVLVKATDTVGQALGHPAGTVSAAAVDAVIAHNTPGAANAAVLGPDSTAVAQQAPST